MSVTTYTLTQSAHFPPIQGAKNSMSGQCKRSVYAERAWYLGEPVQDNPRRPGHSQQEPLMAILNDGYVLQA